MQRCHTYKIAVSKYQGRCEQRCEVFVKIQKKIFFLFLFLFFFFLGGGSGRGGGRSQGGCEQRIEVFVKKQKKNGGGGWVGFGGGGGVRVDVNEELKLL